MAQVARQIEGAVGFVGGECAAGRAYQRRRCTGRRIARHHVAAGIDPADRQQFGELADQGFGLERELLGGDFLVVHLARQAHQLFLALQQAQAQALLRVLHIAGDRLLLTLQFLVAQVGDGHRDGREE
ncbi:hypothetical protein D9M69_648510 [compost metagenome]